MRRGLRAGLLLGGAAALFSAGVVFGHGVITATPAAVQSQSQAGNGGLNAIQYCDAFLGHLATDLGTSDTALRNALVQAAGQTLDDAVAKGTITRIEADFIKARLQSVHSCGDLKHGSRSSGSVPPWMTLAKQTLLQDAATALHLSAATLQNDLAAGQTLSQIAQTQGVSEAAFTAALKSQLSGQADALVKQGVITQQQEQLVLSHLDQIVARVWTRNLAHALSGG